MFLITFVNGPAKRHNPPKPHVCKKCNGCWFASSDCNIFSIILCTAAKTTLSVDVNNILLILWSSRECLENNNKIPSFNS